MGTEPWSTLSNGDPTSTRDMCLCIQQHLRARLHRQEFLGRANADERAWAVGLIAMCERVVEREKRMVDTAGRYVIADERERIV